MTQKERIINHLKKYKTITDKQAEDLYGIRRTAARVHELRQDGYKIETAMVAVKDRYGKTTHVARYELKEAA